MRVSSTDDPAIFDISDADFSIAQPWIEVLIPNGGEEWSPGSTREITWDSDGVSGTVFIEYSKDNFIFDIQPITADEENDGSYTWEYLPYDPSDTVRLRISSTDNPSILDTSDADFTFLEGWVRTWGGSDDDTGYGIAFDGSGNAYITGRFRETVDFNPGPGVDEHSSNGSGDAFLSRFDSAGDFQWAHTWGGDYWDNGYGVAIDGNGNAYITGGFQVTVDFDPGPGVDEHTSYGNRDIFLSKFDSAGNFQWARTWGGNGFNEGRGVAIDGSGNAYVTGRFRFTVDFDPGPGVDKHTPNGGYDTFLSKFDSSGEFQWARTWGGNDYHDEGYGVAIDGSGNAYVTGRFQGTVDFDPGPGVDEHTSNGWRDIFLSKFDSAGVFQWVRTWGGGIGYGVAIDGSGNAYVTGWFRFTVDFDPGPGVDEHTSNGDYDTFLSKFGPAGDFQWARTWGGDTYDYGSGVAIDGSGNAYVTGRFRDTVDFDPGPGVDEHTSNVYDDIFLSKFGPAGDFQWARTWGEFDYDSGLGVAIDGSGNAYITGEFGGTVDFNPGPGVDEHTSNGESDIFLSKFPPDGNW